MAVRHVDPQRRRELVCGAGGRRCRQPEQQLELAGGAGRPQPPQRLRGRAPRRGWPRRPGGRARPARSTRVRKPARGSWSGASWSGQRPFTTRTPRPSSIAASASPRLRRHRAGRVIPSSGRGPALPRRSAPASARRTPRRASRSERERPRNRLAPGASASSSGENPSAGALIDRRASRPFSRHGLHRRQVGRAYLAGLLAAPDSRSRRRSPAPVLASVRQASRASSSRGPAT